MATAQKERLAVNIRWMCSPDFPAVLAVEEASFSYPWDADDFRDCARHKNCIQMIAEYHFLVCGFMIYELYTRKLKLLNFAVHPAFRRYGVGSQMIACLVGKMNVYRRTRIVVDVLESSLDAQLFFRSVGFKATEVLRGFFSNGEDAYRMVYRLAKPRE